MSARGDRLASACASPSAILTYVVGTASRIDVVPVSNVRMDVLVQLLVLVRHPVPTGSNS